MKKENKNINFIFGIISIILIFVLIFNYSKTPIEKKEEFTEDPSQMINQIDEDTIEIDITTITDEKSKTYNMDREQIYAIEGDENEVTTFALQGVYQGDVFSSTFFQNETPMMRISKQLIPNNGIIEGYIVQRIENEVTKDISSYIFVDEDWREALPNTQVLWGDAYQYNKEYEFNSIAEGVYMMKIKDDPERFIEGFLISIGGIAVGNILPEDVANDNIVNRTFMRLYS